MNGRVYDYNVGWFMSVDPLIHMEGGSQGINPYSYLMNNPMAGADPTGYDPDVETITVTAEVSEKTVSIGSKLARSNGDAGNFGNHGTSGSSRGASGGNGAKSSGATSNESTESTADLEGQQEISEGLLTAAYGQDEITSAFTDYVWNGSEDNSLGIEAASLAADLTPVVGSFKSIAQTITGSDIITGEELNRWVEAGGILLGIIPGGKLLTKGDKAADVAESSFEYYLKKSNELDVSTMRNSAVFYSGRGNSELAETFAKSNGKTTLEMTPGGNWLDKQNLFGANSPLSPQQAT